jgi:hypothetical protein
MLYQSAILSIFNILNALYDSRRIKKHKRIYHGINGVAYLVLVGLLIWWIKPTFLDGFLFVISAFFNRQITFDGVLNRLRGLSFYYVSTAATPDAIIDRIEIKLFGRNGYLTTVIYAIVLVGLLGYQLICQL